MMNASDFAESCINDDKQAYLVAQYNAALDNGDDVHDAEILHAVIADLQDEIRVMKYERTISDERSGGKNPF